MHGHAASRMPAGHLSSVPGAEGRRLLGHHLLRPHWSSYVHCPLDVLPAGLPPDLPISPFLPALQRLAKLEREVESYWVAEYFRQANK